MKILAIEKELPTAQVDAFQVYAEAEARQVWELQKSGFIREIYFRADENSAVLIIEAETVASAHDQLKQLPLVKNRLIEFELIPLKAYPGFERLFKEPVV